MNWRRIGKSILFYFYPCDWKPLKNGTLIHSKYIIIEMLGVGGYSYAYLVKDKMTNRYYTLKQMKKHVSLFYNRDELLKEGNLFCEMKEKENFPYQIANFVENKQDFVVLNHIKGTPVDVLLFEKSHQYNEAESLELLTRVLIKVAQLHRFNIIHNDLRIPNILIHHNEIAIIDFGLAEKVEQIKQEDVNYELAKLGHFLLFLLYSTYEFEGKPIERSWEEELRLSKNMRTLLRKLLLLDSPFKSVDEVLLFLKQP